MTGVPRADIAFSFQDVSIEYVGKEGTRTRALDGISFQAEAGKITCIVGPTGSGKSTVLRIASGLERPEKGSVIIAGRRPGDLPGNIGYLTQRHTLFPWLRVEDNIGLPFEIRKVPSGERKRRIREIEELLGLQDAGKLYPYEISGGMQQRTAIGRILASEAAVWLMDEPFSALDEKTLHILQRLLLRLVRKNSLSVMFVTHSIDEAVFLADRVVVLSSGPGRVLDVFDIGMVHPRDRLSREYGLLMEKIRREIESVLTEDPETQIFPL